MDAESDRCAVELSDARVDDARLRVPVAIMAMGHGYHRVSQARLTKHGGQRRAGAGADECGALVDALKVIGAKRIVVVAPYMLPLTELVVDYIRNEGFDVLAYRALEIPDNLDVGRHDPARLPDIVKTLPWTPTRSCCPPACRCRRCRPSRRSRR